MSSRVYLSIVIAAAMSTVGLAPAQGSSTVTVDGVYNPANDAYSHKFVFPLILDDGTAAGTTSLLVGLDTPDTNGVSSNLFLYFEVPLEVKDMTWGTGTHLNYDRSSNDVSDDGKIAMNQNTGSEKIAFKWNGSDVEIKLSQRGSTLDGGGKVDSNAKMLEAIANNGNVIGHELSKDGGGAVVKARTSLDYIMTNFPNPAGTLEYWGDFEKDATKSSSNSPALDDTDNYIPADANFADWPFHQSWEVQIAGTFTEGDLAVLLTDPSFFGAQFYELDKNGDPDYSKSNFKLHASPTKFGYNADIVPEDDPEDYPIEELQTIPTPSAAVMGLMAMVGLVARRRR